jgi:ATP-dependent DNA helicase RecQ
MPSRARPTLIGSLAARIGAIGRLPVLGTLARVRDETPGGGRSNSAQRLRAVYGSLAARGMIVDDRTDTSYR